MTGATLARAALALEGTRFRLHGRDPATGLDCIGVLSVSLQSCGVKPMLPNGYRLRMRHIAGLEEIAVACNLGKATGTIQPGDVLIVNPAPCQFHLLIAAGAENFIHAHAGLKRVICGALPGHWPIAGHWRITQTD